MSDLILVHEVDCPRCLGRGKITTLNGDALREIRKAQGISVREMAKILKLSAAYISDIEHCRRAGNADVKQAYQELRQRRKK